MNGPESLGMGESGLESAGVGSGSAVVGAGPDMELWQAQLLSVTDVWGKQLDLHSVGEFEESRAPTHQ